MSTQPAARLTPAQYLDIERAAKEKHEYYAGEMFAMGGASENHNLIVFNISGELRNQLKDTSCRAYANDMRVKVSPSGLYTYPDLIVVCDKPQFDDDMKDTLLNPLVLAEVLSESTESYDRGKKFEHYRKLASLKEYLLIAQDEPHLEHFVREDDDSWRLTEVTGVDRHVALATIKCRLTLAEVYDKVDFTD